MANRKMSDKDFNGLRESIHQFGEILKGKKLAGMRASIHPKPLTPEEIRKIRTKVLHVSQEDFAGIVGESLSAVRMWEQGHRNPSGAVSKIVRLLKVHPERARELMLV